jgi:type II secretory pathway pseudopilin PulG
MRAESRQRGVTLTELTVVMGVVVLLAALSLPAVRALMRSFESGSSTRAMISAALASARAIAAKEQSYVGIRFQKAYNPDNPDPVKAAQYMIFIIHDKQATDLAYGFRAIEGMKPMKLPDSIGVMDWTMIQDAQEAADPCVWEPSADEEVTDLTAFSIVFSPAGKLVIHDVRVRNKDGYTTDSSNDEVFNTENNVTSAADPVGMFIQDDYEWLGLKEEPSGNSFLIYDRRQFERAYRKGQGYSGYLVQLAPIYINAYMGTLISTE